MPDSTNPKPLCRAALYIRVSTEEQAIHGYSLEAQREDLLKYAKAHEMLIVDFYVDDGKSARKPYRTRPGFMRMLADVEAEKVDIILFIKLDRWFRSVGDYYEIQRLLEKHHVSWQATQENYETVTASGRFKVDIMLAVAQNEADRTSERIKFVFASKVARGEAITGKVPPGFRIENKHLVHDPEKVDMVRDMFQHYADHGSKHGTIQYIYDTYGVQMDRHYFSTMLQNTLYKGEFRGNPGYCDPIVEPSLFDRLNVQPNVKASPTGRIYIFSGLAVCAECGYHMSGRHAPNSRTGESIYYRCNRYSNYKSCTNNRMANEEHIETWLLENIESEINSFLVSYEEAKAAPKKKTIDPAVIKRKLERLKDLYVNEMIDLDTYKADYEVYTAQLESLKTSDPPVPAVDVSALRNFLASNFKSGYSALDKEKRRTLWRCIIKEIRLDSQKNITILFA